MTLIKRGDIFTRLVVVEENVEPPKEKKYAKNIGKWHKCQCNCDNHTIIIIPEMSLLNGCTQSCGCLRKEKAKEQININREKIKDKKPRAFELTLDDETKSLTEWANDIGISKQALSKRLKKMSLREALTKEAREYGNQARNDFK